MTECKSCPFCGHEPQVSSYEYHLPSGKVYATQWRVECMDDLCPTQPTTDWHYFTREEAIAAWNRRDERTAKVIENEFGHLLCSECGAMQPEDYETYYCWSCGAKQVDE